MRPPCSIPGCDKPSAGRGWCGTHWRRWKVHGDPLKVAQPGVDYQVKPPCSVEGCERPHHAKSFCSMHHQRWAKHGDPMHVDVGGRPLAGTVPTFHAIHKRLTRTRGPASEHPCIDCGNTADDWSYNNADPEELSGQIGESTCAYSLDLGNYDPRCRSCHRVFDQAGQRTRDAGGRFAASGARISVAPLADPPEWPAAYADGEAAAAGHTHTTEGLF